MLVLSRKLGEKVCMRVPPSDAPTEITVTVVEIDRGKARLGLEAPRETVIYRQELGRFDSKVPGLPRQEATR